MRFHPRAAAGLIHSVPNLIAAIQAYLDADNASPRAFVRTATTQEILTKVRRGRGALQ